MSDDFLKAEMWLAKRLSDHGTIWDSRGIFDGDTTPTVRRDRIRKAILDNGLEAIIVGRRDGKPEDYATAFERLYGEPLVLPVPRGTQSTQRKVLTP